MCFGASVSWDPHVHAVKRSQEGEWKLASPRGRVEVLSMFFSYRDMSSLTHYSNR